MTEVKKEDNKKKTKKKSLTKESLANLIKENTIVTQEMIPTFIGPIDMHADGGILRGDMWEFFGDTGVGKSTALTHLALNLCSQGYKVDYLDFERGQKDTENSLIGNMGLRIFIEQKQFRLKQNLITYTHLEDAYKDAIENEVDFIFIDSMTAVTPTALLEMPIEQATIGVDARLQATFVKKYKAIGRLFGITTIFISQERTKIGINFGEKTEVKAAGAKALGFYCDIRFQFKRGPKITKKERTGIEGVQEVTCGNIARLSTIKNRCNRPEINVPIPILFGQGVSNPYFYYYILEENDYVKTSGAWKTVTIPEFGELRGQGEIGLIQEIAKNKDIVYQFLKERGHFNLIVPEDYSDDEFDETIEIKEDILEEPIESIS